MNFKKNYLTMEEIAEIVDKMVVEEFSYNREVIKVSLVALCCVDFESEGMNAVEIYNFLAKTDTLSQMEEEITNYYIIDKMVREDRSIETAIVESLKKLDKKIDKFAGGINAKELIESFTKEIKGITSLGGK